MALITRGAKAGGGTNYNAGQIILHSEKNTDFNALYSEINGNLENANFGTNAAIATTKLAFSGCRVTNDADIGLGDVTTTLMTWNTETYDTDTYHSTASLTSRLSAPTTGKYLIVGCVVFDTEVSGADSIRRLEIRLNAVGSPTGGTLISSYSVGSPTLTAIFTLTIASVYLLTAADYVELFAYQNSGEGIAASLTVAPSHFSLTRLGA